MPLPLLVLFLACAEAPAPAPSAVTPAPVSAPAASAPVAVPSPALTETQVLRVLAPSPLELKARLDGAGIASNLAPLVPASRFRTPPASADVSAIRAGIRTADALLAGGGEDKATFLARLREIRQGMAEIGAGEGLLSSFDDVITKVENDAASREDFIAELDAVTASMVPEQGWGPADTTGPLVQAGAWLAGTDLVAQAVVKAGSDTAADQLLRQPEVAEYFLQYARTQGADKAPGPVRDALVAALTKLRDIARLERPLTVADAQAVHDAASQLFGFL